MVAGGDNIGSRVEYLLGALLCYAVVRSGIFTVDYTQVYIIFFF